MSVTVTNTGGASLVVSNISISGSNASDFSFSPSAFPITVAAGSSATLNVTFKPAAAGARTATLTISDNAAGSPHSAALSGTGTVPGISASQVSVTFASQLPNTTSNPASITLSNSGKANLVISNLEISGTNAAEFAVSADARPITVAPNGSTTVNITFTPAGSGTRVATLAVTSNAPGSPLLIGLSGTSPDLTQNPGASVSIAPNNANSGTAVTVNIAGSGTNFVQGATTANFGPGISVGNGAPGAFGVVTVTGPSSATAQVNVSALAAAGPRNIFVRTGTHDSAATFTVFPAASGPVANAGRPQFAKLGDTVYLDGSASTGSPLILNWSFLSRPNGSTATLSDPTAVNPSFVVDKDGNYVVELLVTDVVSGEKSAAWVTISTGNTVPTANAGADQVVALGSRVQLDGSGSSDADGDALTYSWVLKAPAGSGATLSDASKPAPTFVADVDGDYVLELTVNDGRGNNSSDSVVVSTQTTSPIANAGANQRVNVGSTVQLDGSASADPDGGPLSYFWAFAYRPAGSTAVLSGDNTANPSFVADVPGTYVVELKVTDDDTPVQHSTMATVVINTSGINSAPTANAGAPQSLHFGGTVQLDGSTSTDPDGDALSYKWSLISKPSGSTAALSSSTIPNPTFVADRTGQYVVQLVVSDGTHTSQPSTALITATTPGFDATPLSLNFGDQLVGTTSNSSAIAIANTGDEDLVLSQIQITGASAGDFAFTTAALPVNVKPGQTTTVNVTFSPSGTGNRTASLVATDNAPGAPHAIALQGNGTQAGFSANQNLDFGSQWVDASSTRSLVINNTGTGPLTISSVAVGGTNAAEFSLPTDLQLPMTVPAGSNTSITLTFKPANTGSRSANVTIAHNAPGSLNIVQLDGSGVRFLPQPASVTFGNQLIHTTSAPQSLTINNNSSVDLVVSTLSITGANASDFALGGETLPITVGAGGSKTLQVIFTPQAAGARSATLTIASNAPGSPHPVTLAGTGTAPVFAATPTDVNFNDQEIGTTSNQIPVTISNSGDGDLIITALDLTGPHHADFAVIAPVLPITIGPGASKDINLTFSPAAAGARTATLAITANDSASPHSIALAGNGITIPRFAVNPASLDFGNELVGNSGQRSLTITNSGTGDLVISSLAISGPNSAEFSTAPGTPITVKAGENATVQVTFTPAGAGSRSATLAISHNAANSPNSVALSGTGIAPSANLSASSITFSSQNVGTTSAAKSLTITNSGDADLVISSAVLGGAHAGDFALVSPPSFPKTVTRGGGTLTLNLTFTPSAVGARSAALTLTDNANGSPRSVTLAGNGTAPVFSSSSPSVTFGGQPVSTTSSPTVVTITNVGDGEMLVSNVALAGLHASDFAFTASAPPIALPPGASTTVSITFAPTAEGQRSASLVITDSAAGNPHSIPLSGTGTAPAFGISPTILAFGNQLVGTTTTARQITITNNGTAQLVISAIDLAGSNPPDFGFSAGTLPLSITTGASVTIDVTFTPSVTGNRSASLRISDNAAGSPHSVPLSGTGVAPAITAAPDPVNFGSQLVNTSSAAQTLTITNTGTADLVVSGLSLGGANAGDFSISPASLPVTIAPGAATQISVAFQPLAAGARTASLLIASNAAGSPKSVALSGTGTAPVFAANPSSVAFGNQPVNTTSNAQTITISNTGDGDLVVSNITVTGTNSGEFSVSPTSFTVAPGGNAGVSVTFTPTATGARSAALSITSNAAGSPHTIPLTGKGTAPVIQLDSAAITFPSQPVNTSNSIVLTVTNTGDAPLIISAVSISGSEASEFTHNAVVGGGAQITVAPGASTPITVTFSPLLPGSRTATLTLTSNASGSPHTVALSGTATANGQLSLNSFSLGYNLEVLATASVDNPPTATLNVTISSSDPTKLLLATDPTVLGQPSVTLPIPAGFNALFPGFWAQAQVSSGTAQIRVSAPGYIATTATVTFAPSGFLINGSNFTTSTLSADTSIQVKIAQLDSGLNVVAGDVRLRGGLSVNVPVSSSNTATGTIVNSPAVFQGGSSTVNGPAFHPQAEGTTTITANPPAGFQVPVTGASVTATVTGPHINLGQATVGVNLQTFAGGFLEVAPSADLPVTITSSNPAVVLLSTDGTVQGSASITVTVPRNSRFLPGYYVQGIAPSNTAITLTASAPGYANATAQVALNPSGFVIAGPQGAQAFSTTTISPPSAISVSVMQLNPTTLAPVSSGQIRGGLTVTVPLTSSDTGVGTVTNSVTFQPGQSVANGNFQPAGLGSTTLSLGVPSDPNFTPSSSQTQATATVTAPAISLNAPTNRIGNQLQTQASGSLNTAAPSNLQVTITSGSPDVLLSSSPTGPGSQSITLTVQATFKTIPLYYIQALNASGTVTLTATAPGWTSGTLNVELTPSGLVLTNPAGEIAQDFSVLATGSNVALGIRAWQLDPVTHAQQAEQALRGGLNMNLTVTSSSPSVGTIASSPMLTGGSSATTVQFDPASVGDTLLTVQQPPGGFITPTVNGINQDRLTAHVH